MNIKLNLELGKTEKRQFELVQKYEGQSDLLPKRQSKNSAGYDMKAAEDKVIPTIWSLVPKASAMFVSKLVEGKNLEDAFKLAMKECKPVMVSTGVKIYMHSDESADMYNRSSNPLKNGLILANGVGVIDSDYVDNPDNEGEVFAQFINVGFRPIKITRGDRIAQVVFHEFLVVDNDDAEGERVGGHGSTGTN